MKRDKARFKERIASEVHTVLKRATKIWGFSIIDFLVMAPSDAVNRKLEQAENIRLRAESSAFGAESLAESKPVHAMRTMRS